ncbi:MAG TPA: 50S ribosomal protein L22 [Polyangia bacterium]|jgi:large subunit ribosomal protein L22
MDAKAVIRYTRMSPRKARIVANMIRGKDIDEAMAILRFQQRKAAKVMRKLLVSAIANAHTNHQLEVDNLIVKTVLVDGGPILKRWMPRAMGRANRMNRRTTHVTIVVGEQG